jgi:hypothetical protein
VSDVLFATVLLVLPVLGHRSLLGSDGDLARHLRLGEWMVSHRALLAVLLRSRGVDPGLAMLASLLTVLTGTMHWLARPHLFTFVGVALLLFLLERTRPRSVWLFAPLFVLWANLHGGSCSGSS